MTKTDTNPNLPRRRLLAATMGPNQYIDALQECGVTPTAMLKKGAPVGVCIGNLDTADTDAMAAARALWIAAGGNDKALAAALAQRGLSMEIDT